VDRFVALVRRKFSVVGSQPGPFVSAPAIACRSCFAVLITDRTI